MSLDAGLDLGLHVVRLALHRRGQAIGGSLEASSDALGDQGHSLDDAIEVVREPVQAVIGASPASHWNC